VRWEHLNRLLETICETLPDSVFALVRTLYRILRYRELVLFIPRRSAWLVLRKGSRFFEPTPRAAAKLALGHDYEKLFAVRPGDIVLDVGSGIGEYALYFARKVAKNGLVIAIEPEPKNATSLRANVRLYRMHNIVTVEKAVWNRKCTLALYLHKGISEHSVIADQGGKNSVMIEAQTLDNIVSDLGIRSVDFLKMDIEGAELEALEGAHSVLNLTKKIVVAAYHSRDGKTTCERVCQILRQRGFEVRPTDDGLVHAARSSARVTESE